MKVNCYRWTCLLFCFLACNLFAQEKPQMRQPTQVQSDSGQTAGTERDPASETLEKTTPADKDSEDRKAGFDWWKFVSLSVGIGGLVFGLWQYLKQREGARQKKLGELEAETEYKKTQQQQRAETAEQRYRAALQEELGSIKILGSPEIESVPVKSARCFCFTRPFGNLAQRKPLRSYKNETAGR